MSSDAASSVRVIPGLSAGAYRTDYLPSITVGSPLPARQDAPALTAHPLESELGQKTLSFSVKIPVSDLTRAAAATKKDSVLFIVTDALSSAVCRNLQKLDKAMEAHFKSSVQQQQQQVGRKRKALETSYKRFVNVGDDGSSLLGRFGLMPEHALELTSLSSMLCKEENKDEASCKFIYARVFITFTALWTRVSQGKLEWGVSRMCKGDGSIKFTGNMYSKPRGPIVFDEADEEVDSDTEIDIEN